ncbi:MAG: hypothetical protein Q8P68_05155 [Candidatus Peregrinibacteria bacterium]|nr:hypothetical protein [Candidatus Peregrinibacteria bacterium]MDZ4244460.1 hypothetical protein [Candidatus Gracilibacteria bacterium]
MKKYSMSVYILPLIIVTTLILSACGTDNARIEACNTDYQSALTQGSCVMQIALEKETEKSALKTCDKIENGVRNTCIRNVAVKFDHKDLCFDNENEIETYICLSNLAEKNKDAEICSEIARSKDKEFCFRKVAVASLDNSICEQITENEEFKQTCIESVEYIRTYEPEEVEVEAETATEAESETEVVPTS